MSSKYTIPTGDGYLGVYSTTGYRADLSIGTLTHVQWLATDTVEAVDVPGEAGVQLLAADVHDQSQADVLCECPVKQKGSGTVVYAKTPALNALREFSAGGDVRIYERSPHGLTVVPAADDPFITGGDA